MSSRRQVELTPQAITDLGDIWVYSSAQWGDGQADAYEEAINQALSDLATFPEMGRRRAEFARPVRSCGVRHHVILYGIEGDRIVVYRILHERRDMKSAALQ